MLSRSPTASRTRAHSRIRTWSSTGFSATPWRTVLYYLNPDWQSDWGGELELWNADLTRCEARIAPVLDRLVVLAHGETFWHGHPQPLASPPGRNRAVIAAYYYTADPAPGAADAHGAIWAPTQK